MAFSAGQTEVTVPLPIIHDNNPNEGCEAVTLAVTAVSSGSAVADGGIHDVTTEAVVLIEEGDFTSAVLGTAPPEGLQVEVGGLSPATAEVCTRMKEESQQQKGHNVWCDLGAAGTIRRWWWFTLSVCCCS